MITIKVEGLQELERRLREFGPKVAKNGLRAANFAGAQVFRDVAKQTAPVRSGFLRANVIAVKRRGPDNVAKHSITVRNKPKVSLVARRADTAKNRKKNRVGKYHQIAGPKTYGRFLEFGTSKMAARPFLRPAFQNNIDAAINAVRTRLAKAIELAARK